jgi:hypothetical protein
VSTAAAAAQSSGSAMVGKAVSGGMLGLAILGTLFV